MAEQLCQCEALAVVQPGEQRGHSGSDAKGMTLNRVPGTQHLTISCLNYPSAGVVLKGCEGERMPSPMGSCFVH